MCKQIIEVFPGCKCVYYVHAVDPCPAKTSKNHKVSRREVYVGGSCKEHSKPKGQTSQRYSYADSGYGTGGSSSSGRNANGSFRGYY